MVAEQDTAGAECVIVDPGWGAAETARNLIAQRGLRPVAILLTHGHLDHVGAAAPLAAEFGIQTWIHPADRHLLTTPGAGLPAEWAPMLQSLTGVERLPEPKLVKEIDPASPLDLAGIEFSFRWAPGHTAGSLLTFVDYPDDESVSGIVFSGDVLFAGSIGRTDLPGSDPEAMRRTVERELLTLDDGIVALPGHGAQTSIGYERATNPYLQPDFWRNQS